MSDMKPAQLRDLIARSGLKRYEAAAKLRVDRVTLWRWLRGHTPISHANATMIRATLR